MSILQNINPQPIHGHWRFGYSLDFHNVARKNAAFQRKSPLAKAMRSDLAFRHVVSDVAEHVIELLAFHELTPDLIVPVPPSDGNADCRVFDLCNLLSGRLAIPVVALRKTRPAPSLRGIEGSEARAIARNGLYAVDEKLEGKHVLVVDDVFYTGATLNAVASVLAVEGKAATVDVIALTRGGGILWADAVADLKALHREFAVNDDEDAYLMDGAYITSDGRFVSGD